MSRKGSGATGAQGHALRRARGTYLLNLAAAGVLAAVVAPAWVFVAVIGPGGTVGGVALLAYSLRLQDEERAEQRAAGAQ